VQTWSLQQTLVLSIEVKYGEFDYVLKSPSNLSQLLIAVYFAYFSNSVEEWQQHFDFYSVTEYYNRRSTSLIDKIPNFIAYNLEIINSNKQYYPVNLVEF
jgi:hypothetical protein